MVAVAGAIAVPALVRLGPPGAGLVIVLAGAGRDLALGITAAFAAAAAVGVAALVLTGRLPAGTSSSTPPVTQRRPARVPD